MIKFAISSHKNYFCHTIPVLKGSLLDSGIPLENIWTFVGGYNRGVSRYPPAQLTYHCMAVAYNSLDFTGLIGVSKLLPPCDDDTWWFLLHDTTYVDTDFYSKLLEFPKNEPTIPLSRNGLYPGGNMGLYSSEWIRNNKDKILDYHNTGSPSEFKTRLVKDEDIFFRDSKTCLNGDDKPIITGPEDFYKNGVMRQIEHFQNIDLYKVKANWSGFTKPWVLEV